MRVKNPHDKFTKRILKKKEVARDFLVSRLPESLLSKVNLNTLRLEDGSYVSEGLKDQYSDLVYSVKLGAEKAFIYVLIEAQSGVDKNQVLRLLKYNLSLWEEHKDPNTGKYPVVYNLVIYSGEQSYDRETSIFEAFSQPDLFLDFLTRPFLIDLRSDSDERILQDKQAALLEWLLKQGKIRDENVIFSQIDLLISLLETSSYAMEAILYIADRTNLTPLEVLEKLIKLDPSKKEDIMTGLARWTQEYEQRGIIKGKQEGLQEGIFKGLQEGKKEGILEGRKKREQELAMKLSKLGVDKKLIEKALQEE